MGDLGYDIYVNEMTAALAGVDDAASLIDQMWQSIDPLQRKLYEDKAVKGTFRLVLLYSTF